MIETGPTPSSALTNDGQRAADVGDVIGGGLGVVDEDGDRHGRGGRRDAQHFARGAVFANHEVA